MIQDNAAWGAKMGMGLTRLYGLLGWPVGHSVSPAMMNSAFAHRGVDATYVAFAVQPLHVEQAIAGLRALGAGGVNVTIPHKQTVFELVSRCTDEAVLAGAVNTVRFEDDGELTGHNTDVAGWWLGLSRALTPGFVPQSVVILGAGGAARAVMSALSLHLPTARIQLVARQQSKATELEGRFAHRLTVQVMPWEHRHGVIHDSDLVINTTPVGMWPQVDASPIDQVDCFHTGQVVQDIVYRPLLTKFMQQAEQRGAVVVDGLRMLVDQGALSFEFWTGVEAPRDLMYRAALQSLGEPTGPGL